MRTELAPLIVVKQEFPDFRNSISENGEENNNNFMIIKSEHDCNNNQPEDLDLLSIKKSKNENFFLCGGFFLLTWKLANNFLLASTILTQNYVLHTQFIYKHFMNNVSRKKFIPNLLKLNGWQLTKKMS